MATLCITVDGKTIMDGDLGKWSSEPPELKHIICEVKTNPKADPWMRDVLNHVAHVGMGGQARCVDVVTRADGYGLTVTWV